MPIGRILPVGLNQGPTNVFAEPRGAVRLDPVTTIDLRVGKEFDLGRGVRLSGQIDVFNLFNANTATGKSDTVPTFGFPTSVLAPRIVRLEARVTF